MKYLIKKIRLPWSRKVIVTPAALLAKDQRELFRYLQSKHSSHLELTTTEYFVPDPQKAIARVFRYGITNHIRENALHVILHFSHGEVWTLSTTNSTGGAQFLEEMARELVSAHLTGGIRPIPASGCGWLDTGGMANWLNGTDELTRTLYRVLQEPFRLDGELLERLYRSPMGIVELEGSLRGIRPQPSPLSPKLADLIRVLKFCGLRSVLPPFYHTLSTAETVEAFRESLAFALANRRMGLFFSRLGITTSIFAELVPLKVLLFSPAEVPGGRYYSLIGAKIVALAEDGSPLLSEHLGGMRVRSAQLPRSEGQSILDAFLASGMVAPHKPSTETERAIQEHPAFQVRYRRSFGGVSLYERRFMGELVDYAAVYGATLARSLNPGNALVAASRGNT